jgi:hypothetical protein
MTEKFMLETSLTHLPTIQQLLDTEVMAEAQIFFGEGLSRRHVSQVIASLTAASARPQSLLVTRLETADVFDRTELTNLAGVVVIGNGSAETAVSEKAQSANSVLAGSHGKSAALKPATPIDLTLQRLQTVCKEACVPLIALPSFGEAGQVFEEIRMNFLREMRTNTTRIYERFLKIVLAEGLEGLVEELSKRADRPVAIETANFQVLAHRNMGATPANQKQALTEHIARALQRNKHDQKKEGLLEALHIKPFKIGRRLVAPVLIDDVPVGFISCATKANENLDLLSDYLQPAAAAATVDFYQRRRDGTIFTVTQKSLLKDLLSGRGLSASDQERVERHFGFDLCDGLFVFAVAITGGDTQRLAESFDESLAMTEVEGTRVFVVPYNHKEGKSWQQFADDLKLRLKKFISSKDGKAELRIQIGAGRLAPNILNLAEAYREARQALIIGTMVDGDSEFSMSYGDLGIKRLLYLMIDHPELERFYEENLGALERYDAEWESELVSTLRVYLVQGSNLNRTARALFIHRHTMNYRLQQIADILKVDIDSQEVLLNLQIAFLIRDMKRGTQRKENL